MPFPDMGAMRSRGIPRADSTMRSRQALVGLAAMLASLTLLGASRSFTQI